MESEEDTATSARRQAASVSRYRTFIYYFPPFTVLTSLWHYCNVLFVEFLIPVSYEDKIVQQWTTHIDASIDQTRLAFTTAAATISHVVLIKNDDDDDVLKLNILNTT